MGGTCTPSATYRSYALYVCSCGILSVLYLMLSLSVLCAVATLAKLYGIEGDLSAIAR